ncbi:MAG: hypothetical protein V1754_01505, partial [Pseudomonadota bacterium]
MKISMNQEKLINTDRWLFIKTPPENEEVFSQVLERGVSGEKRDVEKTLENRKKENEENPEVSGKEGSTENAKTRMRQMVGGDQDSAKGAGEIKGVELDEIVQKIARAISVHRVGSAIEVKIEISTKRFGKVGLGLRLSDGRIHGCLVVRDSFGYELLRDSAQGLGTALEARGLDVESIEVLFDNGQGQNKPFANPFPEEKNFSKDSRRKFPAREKILMRETICVV